MQPDLTCFTSLFSRHFPVSHGHCSIYYSTVNICFLFPSDGIVCHQTFLRLAPSLVYLLHFSSRNRSFFVFCFFNCGKDIQHEIYLLNKFLSAQYSISNYRRCVVQQISRTSSFDKLFRLRKGGNSAICDSMNEPGGPYGDEISWSQKDKYCMIPLT